MCWEQSGKNTSFNCPSLQTHGKVSKSKTKAERDHNKLITNRKWLHYGLKDRRECSLVTALTQIHIPAGFMESQVSPVDRAPQPLPPPRGTAQGVRGVRWALQRCGSVGWPTNLEALDRPPVLLCEWTCFRGWSGPSHLPWRPLGEM